MAMISTLMQYINKHENSTNISYNQLTLNERTRVLGIIM